MHELKTNYTEMGQGRSIFLPSNLRYKEHILSWNYHDELWFPLKHPQIQNICLPHTIHVWWIYLHLVDVYGKCWSIYQPHGSYGYSNWIWNWCFWAALSVGKLFFSQDSRVTSKHHFWVTSEHHHFGSLPNTFWGSLPNTRFKGHFQTQV